MQEKPVEQVRLFIRDQITGRRLFNRKALLALGINPVEAQERGFQISLPSSALVSSYLPSEAEGLRQLGRPHGWSR
jgi:hypothetical protein